MLTEKEIKNYQNKIYRLALSISRNEKDAEDITQNTFIKVMLNLPAFKARSKFSTWIYRIAYNESLMFLRKRRRVFNSTDAYLNYASRLPAGLSVQWSKLPDEQLLDDELKSRIDLSLRNIPIQYRMPILLHHIEGFSLDETARILGVKESTVKTRLHRAYLMLKGHISSYFNDLPARTRKEEVSCGLWNKFLFGYAMETLGANREKSFKRHIKNCDNCNNFLNLYLKAIRITRALTCQDIPKELKEKLNTFLLKSKKT